MLCLLVRTLAVPAHLVTTGQCGGAGDNGDNASGASGWWRDVACYNYYTGAAEQRRSGTLVVVL